LGSEGADAEDMGDGVRVPALGEHRDGDDAADLLAKLVRLPHRVHHFAEEVLVGEVLGLPGVAGALDDLAAETVDLVLCHAPEVVVEGFAGLELFAVDQRVLGLGYGLPFSSKLRKRARRPFSRIFEPSSFVALEARDEVSRPRGDRFRPRRTTEPSR
jgi:hypothetical protein